LLYTSKQALTPHLIQGFDASYYYLEVNIFPSASLQHCIKHCDHCFVYIRWSEHIHIRTRPGLWP